MSRVRFSIGGVEVEAEWNDSATARALREALPFEANGSYWGEEFYFPTPVRMPAEADATDVVEPGTVAYWPEGACLCLFWGPTPASRGSECRAASAVSVVGLVHDAGLLRQLRGKRVRVEAI